MTPPIQLRNQWLTPAEIAAEYGRTDRQVRNWCVDGTLRAFGFLVYRTRNSWWILRPRQRTSEAKSLQF